MPHLFIGKHIPFRQLAAQWMTRSNLLGGVFDAGLSSLATFVIGLYAARRLSPSALGGYAVAFSAFQLASFIPAYLIFAPVEIASVDMPREKRMAVLMQSVKIGAVAAVLGALCVALCMAVWVTAARPAIRLHVVVMLTVPAMVTTFISPIQDHLRRLCHLAGRHWRAAMIGAVQLLVAVTVICILRGQHRWTASAPFTALAAANIVSFTVGGIVSRHDLRQQIKDLSLWRVVGSGRWILAAGVVPSASAFLVSVLVSRIAGVKILGMVESARIAGQPLVVLGQGLSGLVGPRSMEAARNRNLPAARRASKMFDSALAITGILYLVVCGHAWRGNLLAYLLPKAYEIHGLVAATILANIVFNTAHPYRYELLAAGRERTAVWIEVIGNSMRILVATTAALFGAFVVPIGVVALGCSRWTGCIAALRAYYGSPEPERPPEAFMPQSLKQESA